MPQPTSDYPIQPVQFTQVHIDDNFWSPRIRTSCNTTIPSNFEKCEKTGRIDNFAKAGGLMEGAYEGMWFNDSDVFKIIEGASYALQIEENPDLDSYLDALIVKIAAAQEDDGYLYTPRTIDPDNVPPQSGPERWSHLVMSHELYNVGHMYEAAVAHYQATGKRTLLDVALKNANFLITIFGPNGIKDVPGHQEIEMGLVKLARVTGHTKYLDLAKFFLDERGQQGERTLGGEYTQDHLPVIEQREAVGHAVRAIYMYAGMADIAALTNDSDYYDAIMALWENVVNKKTALTGGTGARHEGESFGDNYELPNLTAYNETCAAIANIFWNHRLFLLTGDSKFIDVLERTLYNGFLSGVSLSGTEFFYVNPLSSDGEYHFNSDDTITRQPWFNCSCCPTNIVRLLPSLSGYIYAVKDQSIYVNLYISNKAAFKVGESTFTMVQATQYPWDGTIKVTVDVDQPTDVSLRLRIPGWATGQPLPGDLYSYTMMDVDPISIKIDGDMIQPEIEHGYFVISRNWEGKTEIVIDIPMPVQRVVASEAIQNLAGKVALARGPIVYTFEDIDNTIEIFDIILADTVTFEIVSRPTLFDGVNLLMGHSGKEKFTAIPYYAWGHRGVGKMTVWLNRQ
jgi:DUF1680 family protein